MKRIFVAALAAALALSCSGKPQSQALREAVGSYSRFVDFTLEGRTVLAERAFARSVDRFIRIDSPCNVSRVYIARYVLNEEIPDPNDLATAISYGTLGRCPRELTVARFLAGEDVNRPDLDSHYEAYAALLIDDNAGPLYSLVNNDAIPDFIRSKYYRILGAYTMVDNPAKSRELIGNAAKIDRFNGWTVNLLRDLRLSRAEKIMRGDAIDVIDERIAVLEEQLQ